jgi:integrase
VLHRALAEAVALEKVGRNVANIIEPPKVDAEEIVILSAEQIIDVLAKLKDHTLYPIAVVALGTGLRRGEIVGLQWTDIDLDAGTVRVERSVEETRAQGLRVKPPKTKAGKRTVSMPPSTVEALKDHRRKRLELHMALGLGKLRGDAPVFCTLDGGLLSPDNLSRDWRRAVKALGLPQVMFHSLRHTHASALIAAKLDVLSISRRLGHKSPMVTLNTYGHLFKPKDQEAAGAIEAAMRPTS